MELLEELIKLLGSESKQKVKAPKKTEPAFYGLKMSSEDASKFRGLMAELFNNGYEEAEKQYPLLVASICHILDVVDNDVLQEKPEAESSGRAIADFSEGMELGEKSLGDILSGTIAALKVIERGLRTDFKSEGLAKGTDFHEYLYPSPELNQELHKIGEAMGRRLDEEDLVQILVDYAIDEFEDFRAKIKTGFLGTEVCNRHAILTKSIEEDIPAAEDAIKTYENRYLTAIRRAAMLIDGFCFDLRNLMLNRYESETIKRAVRNALSNIGEPPNTRKYPSGLAALCVSTKAFNVLKQAKIDYIARRDKERESALYMPAALAVYLLSSLNSECVGLNQIRHEELQDHSRDFKGYVDNVRSGTDLATRVADTFKEIAIESRTGFANLFTAQSRRENCDAYLSKEFIEFWNQASKAGWLEALCENIDNLDEFVQEETHFNIVRAAGKSLVMLLKDDDFRLRFKSNPKRLDYSKIEKLQKCDKGLAAAVYGSVTENDDRFIENLARIIPDSHIDARQITISNEMKRFVADLAFSARDYGEEIAYVLGHFEEAKASLALGLAPMTGAITDIEDKVEFSLWFSDNPAVLEHIDTIRNIQPYLRNSKSLQLREGLVELYRKHGKEFCDQHLKKFNNQSMLSYLRIVGLLSKLDKPKLLFKIRDLEKVLMYEAEHSDENGWQGFVNNVLDINPSSKDDYTKLLDTYDVGGIRVGTELPQHANGIDRERLVKTCASLKDTENEELVDILLDLPTYGVTGKLLDKLCEYMANSQFKLFRAFAMKAREDEGDKRLLRLMECYDRDEDLEAVTIESMAEHVSEEPEREPEIGRNGFDYTVVDGYIRENGFDGEEVRKIVEKGFKLGTKKFFGECYLPCKHVLKNIRARNVSATRFYDALHWLIMEKVLTHHTRKGRKLEDACLSVNTHVQDIEAQPLRQYMTHVIHSSTRNS